MDSALQQMIDAVNGTVHHSVYHNFLLVFDRWEVFVMLVMLLYQGLNYWLVKRDLRSLWRHKVGLWCQLLLDPSPVLRPVLVHWQKINMRAFWGRQNRGLTIVTAPLSARACLAKYCSRLIFNSRSCGTSGTTKSMRRHTPNTRCCSVTINVSGVVKVEATTLFMKINFLTHSTWLSLKSCRSRSFVATGHSTPSSYFLCFPLPHRPLSSSFSWTCILLSTSPSPYLLSTCSLINKF